MSEDMSSDGVMQAFDRAAVRFRGPNAETNFPTRQRRCAEQRMAAHAEGFTSSDSQINQEVPGTDVHRLSKLARYHSNGKERQEANSNVPSLGMPV